MLLVTELEKLIIRQKLHVDVEIYQSRWSQGTYSCISELISCKVKCLCPSCSMIRHQITIQLNLLFSWKNRFKFEEGQKDTAWRICEHIFALIEKTHKGFTAAIDSSCNTDRLWVTLANTNNLPTPPKVPKRHVQRVESPLVNDEIVTLDVTEGH